MTAPRRRPFVDLRTAEIVTAAVPRLFLGRFDEAALLQELEQAGLLAGLRERGHADVAISTEYVAGEHRMSVDDASGAAASLVDVRLSEAGTQAAEPVLRSCGVPLLSFLQIHWLQLQDPSRPFSDERPRLPGQRHPGLGLLRPLLERLMQWGAHAGKQALLTLPEYYHNAVFYSARFKFLDPVRQGRFEALRRDTKLMQLSQASAVISQRRIVEEPWGAPLQWEPAEMIAPLDEPLRRCLESPEYVTAAARARDATRFRLR